MLQNKKVKFQTNLLPQTDNVPELNKETPALIRRDLLYFEDILCKDIARFISFEIHSLYFPTQDELTVAKFLKEEKKLLIPLRRHNALLGILLLAEVKNFKPSENLLKMLTLVAEMCLDKIYYLKLKDLDEVCHLPRFNLFMQRTHKEILGITEYFSQSLRSVEDEKIQNTSNFPQFQIEHDDLQDNYNNPIERHSSLGLMVISLLNLEQIKNFYGFQTAEELAIDFSKKLKNSLPEECVCSFLAPDSFAVIFPGGTRRTMENLAKQCTELTASVYAKPKTAILANMQFLPENASVKSCAGYAVYPQDWDGTADSRNKAEISHLLLQKAKIAVQRLINQPINYANKSDNASIPVSSLAFRDILLQGGNIDTIYHYSQVRVNLGKNDGALENMCFSVFQDPEHKHYKGEILLKNVAKNSATAEIIMLNDSSEQMEVGDFLQYIPQSRFQNEFLDEKKTIFYTYKDFTEVVNKQISQENTQKFSLALMQIKWDKIDQLEEINSKNNQIKPENKHIDMFEVAKVIVNFFNENYPDNEFCIGNVSYNSIVLYHPDSLENIKELYEKIVGLIEEKFNILGAVGIANYPYLYLRPADIWEAGRKALDYAVLLPKPHVGIFDTLAINISADRKFSQNDLFGALEEYRMALLADGSNILAWNSLGVCLAELGRHSEANQAFERAYSYSQDDILTCYNLGNTSLALGNKEKAKEYFLACILHDKKHIYARIRLGEIAEKEQNYEEALTQYTIALEDNPENSMPYRCLAKLHIIKEQNDSARELLQTALQKNPDDAISLQILADIYLDANEDAELSEALIRQSLALMPRRRKALATLAKALEIQGRIAEATEVRRNSVRL